MGSQELSVSWKDHSSVLVAVFEKLLSNKSLVDCTVAAEGQYLKVHKVVLSACSPYFEVLLNEDSDKHPIIILRDVKFEDLRRIIDFVYRGEVKLPEDQLVEFLNVAESLQIKGLGAGASEASAKRRFTDELFTKKKTESLTLSRRTRNQLNSSEEKSEEPVPCADVVSIVDNSDTQWQTSSSLTTQNSSSVGSSSVTSNVFTKNVGSTNSLKDFPGSDANRSSANQLPVPVDQLNMDSRTVVKVEINNDDSLEAKDDYGYQAIVNEFPEDSYLLDSGSQSALPSTSHQYSQLTSSHMTSGSLVAVNSLSGPQETESGHSEGLNVPVDEVVLPDFAEVEIVHRERLASRQRGLPASSRISYDASSSIACAPLAPGRTTSPEVGDGSTSRNADGSFVRLHCCERCGRAFGDAYRLRRHTLIHTGEKPFACRVCGRRFRQLPHLKYHARLHLSERSFR